MVERNVAADFHCPHDGAVLERAVDYCPQCGEEFTGAVGTAIKERIENDAVARVVLWLRSDRLGEQQWPGALTDAIERGEWRQKR
jgi:uncharacterized protein with PIN domain